MKVKFACPSCQSSLNKKLSIIDNCKNESCDLFNKVIPTINGKYCLVDFSNSIISNDILLGNTQSKVDRNRTGVRGWLKNRLAYENPISTENYDLIQEELTKKNKNSILIIGGGEIGSGIQKLFKQTEPLVIDVYLNEYVDVIADAHSLPFENSQFDLVIIQAVLEHVVEPTKCVSEIFRVLKSDGMVYAETPFMQQVHEGAYDFHRFTKSGHRFLFKQFSEIKSGILMGLFVSFAWNISFLVQGLSRSKILSKVVRRFLLVFRSIDSLIPYKYHLLGASAFYFLGRKSHKSLSHKEILKYYKK
tara:strand:- start:3222 stop:4133 length:912 start_codon:yes stop_codon:yes gene_type:complete